MGLSFSNLHVRTECPLDEALAMRIAEILMEDADVEPAADVSEANVTVCAGKDSPWVTVLCDETEGDPEELLRKTRALSETLEMPTLAISCFDSDFLCLNLVDAKNAIDLSVVHGNLPFEEMPHGGDPAAWRAYVKDFEHFMHTLRTPSVFAEDALPDLAAELALPAEQAFCTQEEIPENMRVFGFTIS